MEKLELIDSLIEQIDSVKPRDESTLDAAKRRAVMIARNLFGAGSRYLTDIDKIQYYPMFSPAPPETLRKVWDEGVAELRNTVVTMREEV